jgi:hypothetical protein
VGGQRVLLQFGREQEYPNRLRGRARAEAA